MKIMAKLVKGRAGECIDATVTLKFHGEHWLGGDCKGPCILIPTHSHVRTKHCFSVVKMILGEGNAGS